jgi:hypothetical protein
VASGGGPDEDVAEPLPVGAGEDDELPGPQPAVVGRPHRRGEDRIDLRPARTGFGEPGVRPAALDQPQVVPRTEQVTRTLRVGGTGQVGGAGQVDRIGVDRIGVSRRTVRHVGHVH